MALTGLEQQGFTVHLGDVPLLCSFDVPIVKPERTIKITRAALAGSCNVASSPTNYFDARLRRSATETICTLTTATVALTARTFRDFSAPAAGVQEVMSCHNMYLEVLQQGNGARLTRVTLLVNYEVIGN